MALEELGDPLDFEKDPRVIDIDPVLDFAMVLGLVGIG